MDDGGRQSAAHVQRRVLELRRAVARRCNEVASGGVGREASPCHREAHGALGRGWGGTVSFDHGGHAPRRMAGGEAG